MMNCLLKLHDEEIKKTKIQVPVEAYSARGNLKETKNI